MTGTDSRCLTKRPSRDDGAAAWDFNTALRVSTRSQVSHERLQNRLVICSSTVVLKFWLDRVDARRKSFQVYVILLLQELSSILILPTLPWHSMVAARCHVQLALAQRRQLGCVFDPSSPEDQFLPSQGHGRGMCAIILRGVCKSWTSSHLPSTLGFMTTARIASPCFTRPRFELGLVARSTGLRQTSSTVRLPQVAGLFVHPSRCTQRWLVHATHIVLTLCTSRHHV